MRTIPHSINVLGEGSTLGTRDQNVFRPISSHIILKQSIKSAARQVSPTVTKAPSSISSTYWHPPLYRNTSLLSTPPRDLWSDANDTFNDENCENGSAQNDMPFDFLPPRHPFATSSRDEESSNSRARDEESSNFRARDEESSNSRATMKPFPSGFVHLCDIDIVCGRGAPTLVHPGNHAYRELIKQHETAYLCAKRCNKPVIATEVMETLKARRVRFVRRERNDSGLYWAEIREQKAYDKVCQSLREGQPELRRKMLASDARKSSQTQALRQHERNQENFSPLPCF